MKMNWMKLNLLAVVPAALFAFTSCSTTPEGDEAVGVIETADGVAIVETFATTATVSAIDTANRKVTLKFEDGRQTTVKCGPAVANFAQIQVGDRVNAVVTEELAVFLGAGEPPNAEAAAAVALAPIGAKPGGFIADTVRVSATVAAVDAKTRHVTLSLPDGTSKRFKVGKQINLANVKVGENVTVRYTESLAVSVVKP